MERKFDLDAALARLARDEAQAAPAPSDDLLARILADAATVAAAGERAPGAETILTPAPARPSARRMGGHFGWLTAAAAALSLSLGISAGYAGVDPLEYLERKAGVADAEGFDGAPF